jgi:hypothetical protein
VKRREFITLLGGAAVTWPIAARAQQAAMPVIGILNGQSADSYSHLATALRLGLKKEGFVEGQNILLEYRWADGRDERLPAMAVELVNRQVAALVTGGSIWATISAKAVTASPRPRSPKTEIPMLDAFRRGLNESGYVEGKNVATEFRWAGGQYDPLPELAADLVRRRVGVIVTVGGPAPALAANFGSSLHERRHLAVAIFLQSASHLARHHPGQAASEPRSSR